MSLLKLFFSPRYTRCGETQDSSGHQHICSDDHDAGDLFHHCGVFGCGAKWRRKS